MQSLGKKVLGFGQRMAYEKLFHTKVTGRAYLPHRGPFLTARLLVLHRAGVVAGLFGWGR